MRDFNESRWSPQIIEISRPTLTKYVQSGLIKVAILKNSRYDYDIFIKLFHETLFFPKEKEASRTDRGGVNMRLVYSFRIDKNDSVYSSLERMTKVSKELYNQALFEVKTHYAKGGKILSYPKLNKIMKTLPNLEGKINYRLLPAQVAQQTLRLLSQNVNAFFLANRDYQKQPDKYQGRPHFPQFLKKDAHYVVVFTNQKAAIKANGSIQLTQEIALSIPEKEFQKYSSFFIKTDGGGWKTNDSPVSTDSDCSKVQRRFFPCRNRLPERSALSPP